MLTTYLYNVVIIIWIWRKKIQESIIDLKIDEYDLAAWNVINRIYYVQVQSKYMVQSRSNITLPALFIYYYYYYWIMKYMWVY